MSDNNVISDALATGICLGLPGIAVAIATTDGVVYSGTDGFSDIEKKTPIQPNDRFCVGSITKTFVAVVILQLVDEGKLSLEKTVMDYLPNSHVAGSVPNTSSATLRHVLSHQSGVPTWEFEASWIRAARGADIVPGKIWTKTETLEYARRLAPTGKPGERFSYSNTNYTLLGLVIEEVTGNRVETEIRHRILDPLSLRDSYLTSVNDSEEHSAAVDDATKDPSTGRALVSHYHYATRAFVNSAGLSNVFEKVEGSHPYLVNTTEASLSTEWAAGGMVMSVKDLVLYARALRDRALLSPEMATEMFTYRPPSSDELGQDSSGAEGRSLTETNERYYQGICETTEPNGYRMYGHGGLTLGFSSRMLWLEDQDCVVACATNVGLMHSGFEDGASPWDLFFSSVLMPAVKRYLGITAPGKSCA